MTMFDKRNSRILGVFLILLGTAFSATYISEGALKTGFSLFILFLGVVIYWKNL